MDQWVGKKLEELEESGKAENTIVFYYGDHGGVLARSKRYLFETGTQVPFIIHIPEKFKHLWPAETTGSEVDRLISFVDLAPTLLSIAGITIPAFMQSQAFLGEQKSADPEYAIMFRGRMDERTDLIGAVRDMQYRYIRNYMPYRIYGQHIDYLWNAPSVSSWQQTCLEGGCDEIQSAFWNTKPAEELYDTENDPWEVINLASDTAYREELKRMRTANWEWMIKIMDSGFIPEAELSARKGELAVYDYMRNGNVPLDRIVQAAEKVTLLPENNTQNYISYLQSDDSAIRYWGATGILMLGEEGRTLIEYLKAALNDTSPDVIAVVSEALYLLGEEESGLLGLEKVLRSTNQFSRNIALNIIDKIDNDSEMIKNAVINMAKKDGELSRGRYDHRSAKGLFDKWGIEPVDYGITVNW